MLTKNILSGKPLQGTEIIIYVTNIELNKTWTGPLYDITHFINPKTQQRYLQFSNKLT